MVGLRINPFRRQSERRYLAKRSQRVSYDLTPQELADFLERGQLGDESSIGACTDFSALRSARRRFHASGNNDNAGHTERSQSSRLSTETVGNTVTWNSAAIDVEGQFEVRPKNIRNGKVGKSKHVIIKILVEFMKGLKSIPLLTRNQLTICFMVTFFLIVLGMMILLL